MAGAGKDSGGSTGGGKFHIPPPVARPLFLEDPGTETGQVFVPSQYREGTGFSHRQPAVDPFTCSSVTGRCVAKLANFAECVPGKCLLRRFQGSWEYHAGLIATEEERAKRADALARDTNDGPPVWPERDDIGEVPF